MDIMKRPRLQIVDHPPSRSPSGSRTEVEPGTPMMQIPELFELIISYLDKSADLISMACVAKRYTDAALALVWRTPNFQGDPLMNMVHLFPNDTRTRLLAGEDDSFRVDKELFERFDYYSKFIRHLHLWKATPEAFIAKILSTSRPGVWLFPHLLSIHVGCDGDSLHTLGPYLSHSLREVKINHWEPEDAPPVVTPSSKTIAILLQIFELPNLEVLDLMDTRYPDFEQNPTIVDALVSLVPQLVSFASSDFTTLKPIYDALAKSNKLRSIFLDLCEDADGTLHYTLEDLIRITREAFKRLENISILCAGPKAARFLREVDKELLCVDFHIEGPLVVPGLRELVESVAASTKTLRTFKCVSSEPAENTGDDPLIEAIKPLGNMSEIRHVHIGMSFNGEQMLKDGEVYDLFPGWRKIETFTLESDPGAERPVLTEDDPIGYALTLLAVQHIQQNAPNLRELSLSYIDLSQFPDLSRLPPLEHPVPVDILFTRSHAHDRPAIRKYLHTLWRNSSVDFEPCCLETQPYNDHEHDGNNDLHEHHHYHHQQEV